MTDEQYQKARQIKAQAEKQIDTRIGRYDPSTGETPRDYQQRAQTIAREVAGPTVDLYVGLAVGETMARVFIREVDDVKVHAEEPEAAPTIETE